MQGYRVWLWVTVVVAMSVPTQTVDELFLRPFEVFQFWARDEYLCHLRGTDASFARLRKNERPDELWEFEVVLDGKSLRQPLRPFFPTRGNIRRLNDACGTCSRVLAAMAEGSADSAEAEALDPMAGMEYSSVAARRDLSDPTYRAGLFRVLADDWGVDLRRCPEFGTGTVRLRRVDGLPVAPAMERAVERLFADRFDEKLRVETVRTGEHVIDRVHYSTGDGGELIQDYDITDLYGRSAYLTDFSFSGEFGRSSGTDGVSVQPEQETATTPTVEELLAALGSPKSLYADLASNKNVGLFSGRFVIGRFFMWLCVALRCAAGLAALWAVICLFERRFADAAVASLVAWLLAYPAVWQIARVSNWLPRYRIRRLITRSVRSHR